jgi:hypothetical protein
MPIRAMKRTTFANSYNYRKSGRDAVVRLLSINRAVARKLRPEAGLIPFTLCLLALAGLTQVYHCGIFVYCFNVGGQLARI